MRRLAPLWTIPILILFAFATVWLRLTVVQTTYELNEATQIRHNLDLENERLELRVSELRSPRRLELLAKQKFKLSSPKTEQMIQMKE